MSATETTGKGAGELVYPQTNEIWRRGVKASENLAVGDPVTFDANGFVRKASNTVGNRALGLGVCKEAGDNSSGADGDIFVQVVMPPTWVMFKAGAAVKPYNLLKLNSSNKAIAHTNPANAATIFDKLELDAARDYYGLAFGRYYGKEREDKDQTDSADNDIIVIHLGVD